MRSNEQILAAAQRNRKKRHAYILIVVLGLATVVSSLGIAFIEANSTSMPSAANRKHAARAQYLAESGVELAKHYLLYPTTKVPFGDYWHGESNIAIDDTSDFTSVQVTQHASFKDRFRILAHGISKDFDGSVRGKKEITAEVLLPPGNIWDIRYALVGKSLTTSIPANVQIAGNVHGNGSLTGSGKCTGAVSACVTALWLGSGPPTSVLSLAPAVALPLANPSYYASYQLRGTTYNSRLFDAGTMSSAEASALNAIDMSATNPGRIVRAKSGNFRLNTGTRLSGTLLVTSGRLEIDGAVQIVAQPGFPAIVCSGPIEFQSTNSTLQVTGAIICDSITDGGKAKVGLVANGATIMTNSPQVNGLLSSFQFVFDADRCWFYNFETAPARQPITVLSWQES